MFLKLEIDVLRSASSKFIGTAEELSCTFFIDGAIYTMICQIIGIS